MAFIEEAVISGFISKVINDCADITKAKIKEADKNRKDNEKNIQTRIYQVIIDTINVKTCYKYNNQDILYDAAETLLKSLKNSNDDSIIVKDALSILMSDVDHDICNEFMKMLLTEISKESNWDLYKEILMLILEQTAEDNYKELQQIKEELKSITQKLDENIKSSKGNNLLAKVKSRTQEYADKWETNMFLNDYDKRDENAGVNVKLSEVYLDEHLPHYIWGDNESNKPLTDLKELLWEYINEKKYSEMLLILGQPGIGKSTLITWIVANFNDRMDDILVYKFAADLKDIDWKDGPIFNSILEKLQLKYDDLHNKILVLDGFDEISIDQNMRKYILDSLYGDAIYGNILEKFLLIITCREHYIKKYERIKCKYITLQPWDEIQIKSFCNVFGMETMNTVSNSLIEKFIENKEILGVPLILYMALALNISIEKEGSIVDIYDKIFSLDGGIYDRCIDNKKFADNHRIGEVKKYIHQISREISMWMFENNADEANIPIKNYENICSIVMQDSAYDSKKIKEDYFIGNYFKLVRHCEGVDAEVIYFIHRSIYEYFVTDTIYSSINETIDISVESLAGVLGDILKGYILSNDILQLLNNKFMKSRIYYLFDKIYEAFNLMISDGMTYYAKRSYKNVVNCEKNVFINMLEIIHLLEEDDFLRFNKSICNYIRLNHIKNDFEHKIDELCPLNLKGLDFSYMNMQCINLKNADLSRTRLYYTNLSNSILVNAMLCNAILVEGKFINADMRNANLEGANLEKADLTGADLSDSNLQNANLEGAVISRLQIFRAKIDNSIWNVHDLINVYSQLRETNFSYIVITNSFHRVRMSSKEFFNVDYEGLVNLVVQGI